MVRPLWVCRRGSTIMNTAVGTSVHKGKRKGRDTAHRPYDTSWALRVGASLASFEYLRLPLELLFEFRDRRRLLRFGQRWVGADHLDFALDEGALSLGIAA
jgi:hypothetical protein